jgi:acid phosphatase
LKSFKVAALAVLAQALFSFAALAQEKLIFAVDIIRHGDRSPIHEIPKAPHKWPDGSGQLTALGMRQEFQLGSRMRAYYIEQEHLLPANYVTGSIYVRSTDSDRTLMSAESFLAGLYPPGTGPILADSGQAALPQALQPIPIHTIPRPEDSLLIPDTDARAYDALCQQYVFSSPEWKAKAAELAPDLPRWSEETGIKLTNIFQLKYLGDTLFIDRLRQVPFPAGLSAGEADALIKASRWIFAQGYKPREIGRTTGTALLKAVGKYLEDAARKKSALKYVLFSAHDSTIMSALSAMGAPLEGVPPYSSRLGFALRETEPGKFRIDVSLNDTPVTVPAWNGGSCSPAQFNELVDSNEKWLKQAK